MLSIREGVSGFSPKMALKVLQINLNHCGAAQDLLSQTVRENKVEVVIVADQYRNVDGLSWRIDATGSAAIWACGKQPFQEVMKDPQKYFVRAKIGGIHFYSCYMPPSMSQQDFEEVVDRLVGDAKDRSPIAIAGDFNAWAVEWGSKETKKRGQVLLEAFSALDITLLNDGDKPTFVRGEASSMIDLTFISSGLAKGSTCWKVTDICTQSDHCAIIWSVPRHQRSMRRQPKKSIGWKTSTFDADTLSVCIEGECADGATAEDKVANVMRKVTDACDATMSRRGKANPHTPVYWWSDKIAKLRSECHKARRRAQRARGKRTFPELEERFKLARSTLTKAIKRSKRKCWTELLGIVDEDPWGRPYKVVMTRLKSQSRQQPTCPEQLQLIVGTLFPKQEPYRYQVEEELGDIPLVTTDELMEANNRIGNNKAPGLDNIPNVAFKTAVKAAPEMFLDMYNTCFAEGVFPERWRRQRLVLLPKGDKPPDDPSSYRPLCMLDTAGKILERFIFNRIEAAMGHLLADNQYGFRKGRSTVDAINQVVSKGREAISGKRWKRGGKQYCLLATLDVKNAFNSARWENICLALDKLGVPAYLRKMINSYLENRILVYDTEDGLKRYQVTGGVPQGSVLGPLLWNIMYDDLLKTELPSGTEIVAFADDAGLLITGKHLEEIQRLFGECYEIVQQWMGTVGLKLADHKTEAVLFTSRKKVETITLDAGECTITSQPSIRYLGVILDTRLKYKTHIEHVAGKAAKVATALARLMPNIGGPRQPRRRLLASVVTSVLTYGITIWGEALKYEDYRRKIAAVNRLSALRVSCAFRTVSDDAVCVIAGLIPIEILAVERRQLYETRSNIPEEREELRKIMRQDSLQRWQQKWDASEKGRWTYRLIPQLDCWINRKHGEINYYLTQILSDHGCFRAYLHRVRHDESSECTAGCGVTEDAEHAVFWCPRFADQRRKLVEDLRAIPEPENLVKLMLEAEENWIAVSNFAKAIMTALRAEERRRRMMRTPATQTPCSL